MPSFPASLVKTTEAPAPRRRLPRVAAGMSERLPRARIRAECFTSTLSVALTATQRGGPRNGPILQLGKLRRRALKWIA